MQHLTTKTHYKKCSFPDCGLVNRRVSDGTSFHSFPANDSDRCVIWLLNCGLDDWVELSESELKKKYICSRHFSKESFRPSGALRKNAVPHCSWLGEVDNSHDSNVDTKTALASKVNNKLERQLTDTEQQLKRAMDDLRMLRLQLRAKSKVINRLKTNIASGRISDRHLRRAILRKVRGKASTVVQRLLFGSNFHLLRRVKKRKEDLG